MKEGAKWTQWQALQWKSLREYRKELSDIADKAFEVIVPEAEKQISSAYHDASNSYDKDIMEQYKAAGKEIPHERLPVYEPEKPIDSMITPIGDETFFKINKQKLENIVKDVKTDLNISRYAAARRSGVVYEDILKRADVALSTGTITPYQAIERATKEAARHGLNCIQYKDGRRVNVASYVEMALRTSQHRAVLQAEGVKRDQWGDHLVTSAVLHSTCDSCHYWQGEILIDDVFASGKPDGEHQLLSYAVRVHPTATGDKSSHFLGPNCRHPLITFIEGVTSKRKNSPLDRTKSNYEAEQRQRTIELRIREWKRREIMAQTEKGKEFAAQKVKDWQKEMRDHLKKNPQLRRIYQREQLLDVA